MERFPMPKVFGAVTMGERGQIVIPVEVRKLYHIKAGDRVIVFSKPGGPIALIPADEFSRFLDRATSVMKKIRKKAA
jgi:AbrB family looped-hinge helix DNA binding protein